MSRLQSPTRESCIGADICGTTSQGAAEAVLQPITVYATPLNPDVAKAAVRSLATPGGGNPNSGGNNSGGGGGRVTVIAAGHAIEAVTVITIGVGVAISSPIEATFGVAVVAITGSYLVGESIGRLFVRP